MGLKMSPDEAAQELDKQLRIYSWYLSTGVGRTEDGAALFVYVKSRNHPELKSVKKGWRGYTVLIRAVGTIHPVANGKGNRLVAS